MLAVSLRIVLRAKAVSPLFQGDKKASGAVTGQSTLSCQIFPPPSLPRHCHSPGYTLHSGDKESLPNQSACPILLSGSHSLSLPQSANLKNESISPMGPSSGCFRSSMTDDLIFSISKCCGLHSSVTLVLGPSRRVTDVVYLAVALPCPFLLHLCPCHVSRHLGRLEPPRMALEHPVWCSNSLAC